jgi:hypothetical protein
MDATAVLFVAAVFAVDLAAGIVDSLDDVVMVPFAVAVVDAVDHHLFIVYYFAFRLIDFFGINSFTLVSSSNSFWYSFPSGCSLPSYGLVVVLAIFHTKSEHSSNQPSRYDPNQPLYNITERYDPDSPF